MYSSSLLESPPYLPDELLPAPSSPLSPPRTNMFSPKVKTVCPCIHSLHPPPSFVFAPFTSSSALSCLPPFCRTDRARPPLSPFSLPSPLSWELRGLTDEDGRQIADPELEREGGTELGRASLIPMVPLRTVDSTHTCTLVWDSSAFRFPPLCRFQKIYLIDFKFIHTFHSVLHTMVNYFPM